MSNVLRPVLFLGLAAAVAACSGGAASSPDPGGSGAPSGSPPPSTGEIEHPTGATDVVLRYEEGGGFVMADFAASQAPIFTLYGDGTIVFRNPALEPPVGEGPVTLRAPFRTAKLGEDDVQELLLFALTEGGLATAKPEYPNNMVADAGTATFTIRAGGLEKVVNVYALGLDVEGDPDQLDREKFGALAERLANIDQNGSIPTDVYTPAAYRGVLIEAGEGVGGNVIPWPWDDIAPSDFVSNEASGTTFPSRVMTPEDLAVFELEGIEGGFSGITLRGPSGDSKSYSFVARPLLPDEMP